MWTSLYLTYWETFKKPCSDTSRTPKEVCKCLISTGKRESRLVGKVYNLCRV
uniref:Uncharacterized protein n=1 Tax=Arundo donax TaxID=35708 RepID=A0A0A9HKW0_ARUDO